MTDPTPRLAADAPVEVLSARRLFAGPPMRRNAASVIRLEESGRLLLVFSQGPGAAIRNDTAIMLATSDDDGETWTDPRPIYAYPGWFCLAMGGLARVADDERQAAARPHLHRLLAGRHRADDRLVGRLHDQPRRRRDVVRAGRPRSASSPTGPSCMARATRIRCPMDGCCGR